MIKKTLSIILFLSLSLFLVMPVSATEPPAFEKTTDIYSNELDYRNSLIDYNGYNLDFDIYWNKQGGMPPDFCGLYVVENDVFLYVLDVWVYDNDKDMFKLTITNERKQKILNIIFSRNYNTTNKIYFNTRTADFEGFLFETRITFKSLLNINLGSIYVADSLRQTHNGLIGGFALTLDIIGVENSIGGGQATFIIDRLTLETETSHPIGLTETAGSQLAQYNLVNKYTNVYALYFNVVISANSYDPETAATLYYIYQLGFFADAQVILPDLNIDTDFQIYAPTICGALDIACVSRNLIGEFSNNIYKQLGAETIAGGVMVIYDTLFYPVYIVDDTGWQNGIISLYAMLVVGVLYLIVKRVLS